MANNKARHCSKFQWLCGVQHLFPVADSRKMVVNLNNVPMEDAAYSTLGRGLKYVMVPAVLPIMDVISSVEKAVCSLLEEVAEEVQQETIRILKASSKPKDNLSVAERRAVWALRTNSDPTVLPGNKGNMMVVLSTS